jgi:hypothetical protein
VSCEGGEEESVVSSRCQAESKSVVRSGRELEYAAMTKTPNLSLNLAADR